MNNILMTAKAGTILLKRDPSKELTVFEMHTLVKLADNDLFTAILTAYNAGYAAGMGIAVNHETEEPND